MTDRVETALPWLIFSATATGDTYGLGRFVVDEDQAVDQQWMVWGMETDRYYTHTTSSGSGALAYEAESRTALGGSATAVGPAGASGAGSNVMRNTALTTSYQAILSTQATGGGAHLTHVGSFNVWARVQTPTVGTVSVALEWGEGDFRRFTQNPAQTVGSADRNTWRLLDLGIVTLTKPAQGAARWEGRVIAKSTVVGDDVDVDWLMLVPTDVASGQVKAVNRGPSSTGFSARDEFDQTAGAVTGKTLPVGGTWTGSGSVTDFTVETTAGNTHANALKRSTNDGSQTAGRYIQAGTTNFTNVTASVKISCDPVGAIGGHAHGVIMRYTDTNNWLFCGAGASTGGAFQVVKRVAGTVTTISTPANFLALGSGPFREPNPATIACTVYANGLWIATVNGNLVTLSGYDADLATGGTLATGKAGIYDAGSNTTERAYDDFSVAVPPVDAAAFASQSLEIRHDGVIREDSTGAFWQKPSSYIGDYLRVPPSGAGATSIRTIVKFSRFAPGEGPDAGTDDLSAKLFNIPRFLT